jgi:hypothetical protein
MDLECVQVFRTLVLGATVCAVLGVCTELGTEYHFSSWGKRNGTEYVLSYSLALSRVFPLKDKTVT